MAGVLAGSLLLCGTVSPALAQDPWEVTLMPYLWMTGVDGDFQIRGQDIESSADFGDIVDNLDIGGSVLLEPVKGRWVSLIQLDYLSLENDDAELRNGSDVHLEIDTTIASLASGYRFGGDGKRRFYDLMVGMRYLRLETGLGIQDRVTGTPTTVSTTPW